jgi:hypothetical protein
MRYTNRTVTGHTGRSKRFHSLPSLEALNSPIGPIFCQNISIFADANPTFLLVRIRVIPSCLGGPVDGSIRDFAIIFERAVWGLD